MGVEAFDTDILGHTRRRNGAVWVIRSVLVHLVVLGMMFDIMRLLERR